MHLYKLVCVLYSRWYPSLLLSGIAHVENASVQPQYFYATGISVIHVFYKHMQTLALSSADWN